MIYCLNCGKGIPDHSKFCTFCGTALAADSDQANVPPHNTPPAQQFVNPAPPVQPFVSPNPPVQQHVKSQPITTKNEFYKNVGFWGAVLAFAGFFLPYDKLTEASLYFYVSEVGSMVPEYYLYLVFPIAGAILILQGLTGGLPKLIVGISKILPLLVVIFIGIGLANNESKYGLGSTDIGSILNIFSIGFYMIVIGSILILFFKTTKSQVRTA